MVGSKNRQFRPVSNQCRYGLKCREELSKESVLQEGRLTGRNFLALWVGQLFSHIAVGVYYFTARWFVYELTDSAFQAGLLMVVASIPVLFASPLFGVAVDRFNRKFILVFTDIARAMLLIGVGVSAGFGKLTIIGLYGATLVIGVLTCLFNPCVWALIPGIVSRDQLSRANSLVQLLTPLSFFVGPLIAAVVLGAVEGGGMFVVGSEAHKIPQEGWLYAFATGFAFFLLSSGSTALLRLRRVTPASLRKAKSFVHDMKEAFHFLQSDRLMFAVLKVGCILNFFVGGYSVALLVLTTDVYERGVLACGLLEGALALGFVLGSIYIAIVGDSPRKGAVLIRGLFLQAIFITLIGFVPYFGAGLTMLWAIGVANAIVNINMLVIFQIRVPDDKRGRIFSFRETITTGLFPLSYAVIGFAVDKFPFWFICSVCGVAWVLGSLYLKLLPGIEEV